jgi:hypothetical protein
MKTLDDIGASVSWDKRINDATRFQLIWEGTAVLDHETGLVWGRSLARDRVTGALLNIPPVECAKFHAGGRAGFRVPRLGELTSLFTINPATGARSFPLDVTFNWRVTQDNNGPYGIVASDSYYVATSLGLSQDHGSLAHYVVFMQAVPEKIISVGDVKEQLNNGGIRTHDAIACVRGPE